MRGIRAPARARAAAGVSGPAWPFRAWWGLWLFSNFLNNTAFRLTLQTRDSIAQRLELSWLQVAAGLLDVPLCAVTLAVAQSSRSMRARLEVVHT